MVKIVDGNIAYVTKSDIKRHYMVIHVEKGDLCYFRICCKDFKILSVKRINHKNG